MAEGIFLIGAERNADKIIGSTYVSTSPAILSSTNRWISLPTSETVLTKTQAPFFMNVDEYQWSPTFLAFNADPSQTARSTSWHLYNVRPLTPCMNLHG